MEQNMKTKIAFWYYSCGLTQEEIANRLSITRQKVNSIIGSLKEEGIVSVSIHGCEREYLEWEQLLEEHFHLKQVIIVPDYDSEELAFLKVANAAAQYLEQTLLPGQTIGVSWGRTVAATVKEMRFQKKNDCQVMQLCGAQSMDRSPIKSDDIVRLLAEKLDCPTYMLYAPVIVSSPETKALLMKEKPICRSFEMMDKCDVGIFGIGVLKEEAPMCQMGYLTKDEIKKLNENGFCADIGMNPVRADGSTDGCFLQERLLNASPDCIKKIKHTIGVASGKEKAEAVTAVLCSNLLDALIIDYALAKKILSIIKKEKK